MVPYIDKYEVLTYPQYKQQLCNYIDRTKVFIFWKESVGLGTIIDNDNNKEIMKHILNNNPNAIIDKFEDVIVITSNNQARTSI